MTTIILNIITSFFTSGALTTLFQYLFKNNYEKYLKEQLESYTLKLSTILTLNQNLKSAERDAFISYHSDLFNYIVSISRINFSNIKRVNKEFYIKYVLDVNDNETKLVYSFSNIRLFNDCETVKKQFEDILDLARNQIYYTQKSTEKIINMNDQISFIKENNSDKKELDDEILLDIRRFNDLIEENSKEYYDEIKKISIDINNKYQEILETIRISMKQIKLENSSFIQ